MRPALKTLCCLSLFLAAYAQEQSSPLVEIDNAPQPSDRFPASWYPPNDSVTYPVSIQKNVPYTGTLVTTYLDEVDGKIVPRSTSTLQARGSAGRMRDEVVSGGHTTKEGVQIIDRSVTVVDPVSHCKFQWREPADAPRSGSENPPPDSQEQLLAVVDCMPLTIQYVNENIGNDAFASLIVNERKEEHHELWSSVEQPLGRRTFGDVQALGMRSTVVNTKPGTAETFETMREFWYSREIGQVVEMLDREPVVGTKTLHDNLIPDIELTDIKRTEPPVSLFYPPAGCVIVKTP